MVNEVKHDNGIFKDQSAVAGGPLVYQIQISGQLGHIRPTGLRV